MLGARPVLNVSGILATGAQYGVPLDLRILRILFPVTTLTCATPWLSRRTTPICDGVTPFFASLQMLSTTCSGVLLNQVGTARE